MQKTTIQLEKSTAEKLKGVGTMGDTYDTVVLRLIDEHMKMKMIDFFVETQQRETQLKVNGVKIRKLARGPLEHLSGLLKSPLSTIQLSQQ